MRALTFILVLFFSTAAMAVPAKFPVLSGRVVDEAHVLSPSGMRMLNQMLADYEKGTTNQVVVVTLASLRGLSIEDYGYQLGRHWQIGQSGQNNGVLLIVVPHEHKVRIEVGYGLEPILTDAAANEIIDRVILPQFKNGAMEAGIIDGTKAIISVLGGNSVPAGDVQPVMTPTEVWIILGLFCWFWYLQFLSLRHPLIAGFLLANRSIRFGSSGLNDRGWGGNGGGYSFSGGGGSFGGGGASGGW